MNLRKKIQEAQILFGAKLEKTGKANYGSYHSLKDLLKVLLKAQSELDFTTHTSIDKDLAKLVIMDDSDTLEITIPIPEIEKGGKAGSSMQNVGGISTYARRYLLLQAFNIVEEDVIENGELQRIADANRIQEEKEKKDIDKLRSKIRSIGASKGYSDKEIGEMASFVKGEERGTKPYYIKLLAYVETISKKIENGAMFPAEEHAGKGEMG